MHENEDNTYHDEDISFDRGDASEKRTTAQHEPHDDDDDCLYAWTWVKNRRMVSLDVVGEIRGFAGDNPIQVVASTKKKAVSRARR